MTARRQLGFLWGSVALALVALSPLAERLAGGLPACPVKSILGVPCAGCGATRAALALASLDLWSAWTASPLATLAWIAVIVGGVVAGSAALVDRPLPVLEPRPPDVSRLANRLAFRAALLGIILANWAYLILAGT